MADSATGTVQNSGSQDWPSRACWRRSINDTPGLRGDTEEPIRGLEVSCVGSACVGSDRGVSASKGSRNGAIGRSRAEAGVGAVCAALAVGVIAAPQKANPRRVCGGLVRQKAPGGDLLLHGLSHTTIGAGAFHCRVRDGIGWYHTAMAAREGVECAAVWGRRAHA